MRSFDFKVCLKFDSTCNGFLSFVVLQNLSIHVGFPFDLICRLTFPFLFHSNSPRNVQKFLWFLIIQITVPKLSISQSEAMSTVLISYDIKSLTWYGYDITLTSNVGCRNFGLAMGILAQLRLTKIRTTAPPNSPDMPPKRTKTVRLGLNTAI